MVSYDKADLGMRFLAFFIDLVICVAIFMVLDLVSGPLGAICATAYVLVRDGLFNGQSVGKKILKLRVVQVEEGRNANYLDSVVRNLTLAIPFVGWFILSIVEGVFVLSDEDGIRLGDKLARTQVTPVESSQA